MSNIIPLPRLHRTLAPYTPTNPPVPNWWQRLSAGQRTDLVLGTILLVLFCAAYCFAPDVLP